MSDNPQPAKLPTRSSTRAPAALVSSARPPNTHALFLSKPACAISWRCHTHYTAAGVSRVWSPQKRPPGGSLPRVCNRSDAVVGLHPPAPGCVGCKVDETVADDADRRPAQQPAHLHRKKKRKFAVREIREAGCWQLTIQSGTPVKDSECRQHETTRRVPAGSAAIQAEAVPALCSMSPTQPTSCLHHTLCACTPVCVLTNRQQPTANQQGGASSQR